jgi:hypothetical protein
MFERQGRLAWLLLAFALSPWTSEAADPPAPAQQGPAQKDQVQKGATQKQQNDQSTSASKATDAADQEADDELLEFLGSVDDADDRELIDYLARTKAAAPNKAKSASAASNDGHEK